MVHFGRLLLGSLLVVALVACAAPTAGSKPAAGAAAPAPVAPTASTAAASAGSGQAPASAASAPAPLNPPVTVQVASVGSIADAGLYVAMDRGYFAAEGLQIEISATNGISRIISALSPNQVDVAGGTGGAALFNAYSRDIPVKLVADKGRLSPGRGYFALMVRQDLLDSGQFKTLADLRGKTIAANLLNTGSIGEHLLDLVLEKGGVPREATNLVDLTYADMTAGYGNKSIDAAVQLEPMASVAVARGLASRFLALDEVAPEHQVGVLMYGPRFAETEAARRFMVAYLRGVRDYNDALFHGGDRAAIVDILTRYSTVKEAALYEQMMMPAMNPDGYVNKASIQKDYDYYRGRSFIQQDVGINEVVDDGFVDYAVQRLGKYQPRS